MNTEALNRTDLWFCAFVDGYATCLIAYLSDNGDDTPFRELCRGIKFEAIEKYVPDYVERLTPYKSYFIL